MGSKKNMITIRQTKSGIGKHKNHKATLRGLGLRKVNSKRSLEDTPSVRGMINKVSYMVEVVREDS